MTLNKNSVAVVTGTGSGIGRSLSIALANENIRGIVISDINSDGLAETAGLLPDNGTEVISVTADVSKLEDVEQLKETALDKFGVVSHLFNNAGVGLVGRTDEISYEDMEWLFDINFWGTVYGTKTFLPVFKKQEFGHITNISSVFGLISPPGQSAYCASKFAVRGFSESLRHELEGTEVYISCVHPGGIRTEIAREARVGKNAPEADKQSSAKLFDKLARTTPDQAADTIIRGVKARSPRILIGNDARQISAVQRLFPIRYFSVLDRLSGGLLSKLR